jgi:hypothetical protein
MFIFEYFISYFLYFKYRLQQQPLSDKESPNIVADDVSSCDEDGSESEEQEENKLPMVIVRGMSN